MIEQTNGEGGTNLTELHVSKYCPLQEMELNSMPIHVKTLRKLD